MTRKEMLLTLISEECNEIGQRASKALRFGLEEIQDGQNENNAERLMGEFCDLVAVLQILADDDPAVKAAMERRLVDTNDAKKAKVEKWLKYSKEMGTLQD